jgi:tRNA-Thr(GGU) m(6)t(6)A37 methyltransferase TsaA
MNAQLNFIGRVHSSLKQLEDCPRQESEQAPRATIEIFTDYQQGLSHLKTGSKLILFTWLDKADRTVLKTHPRNDKNIELTGIFSTRSPDRPNPIGIHFVKVISLLDENKFVVENLEVLDNTPIVDIKPDF